jgi:peptidyl-dipeptidase A
MATVAPHRLVNELQARISQLETEFHRAYWDSQVEASPESDGRRAALEIELRRVKGDPESLVAVEAALADDVYDPILRRQLQVLRLSLKANQMADDLRSRLVALSTEIESLFASFRPTVNGRRLSDNDILKMLASSSDVELRRLTWEASKEIGESVQARVRELARLRNQAAREQGFADYYRMSLELAEVPEEWLFEFLNEVVELTEAPFERYKSDLDSRLAQRFDTEILYPWHYADPFFQELPTDGQVDLDVVFGDARADELARETFEGWGIDLAPVLKRSDLFPRERKSQHAFCLDVDREGDDVRILANIVPGERWVSVMLHESGHAAYDVEIDRQLPYLLRRPPHIFVTEASAILSGRLSRDPVWLAEVAKVTTAEIAPVEQRLISGNAAQDLIMARWVPVMAHFERELYADPDADLDNLWWELVERFQHINRPPDRLAPDWAAKIHISAAPVYYHNYLLGAALASQLEDACHRDVGRIVANKEAGGWLVEHLYRPGNVIRWDPLVESATGSRLGAKAFARWVDQV